MRHLWSVVVINLGRCDTSRCQRRVKLSLDTHAVQVAMDAVIPFGRELVSNIADGAAGSGLRQLEGPFNRRHAGIRHKPRSDQRADRSPQAVPISE